jgi:hypothetical protein
MSSTDDNDRETQHDKRDIEMARPRTANKKLVLPDPKPGDIVEGDDGALFRIDESVLSFCSSDPVLFDGKGNVNMTVKTFNEMIGTSKQEEKRLLWQAAASEFANTKFLFIEFNRQLNQNTKYNPKFFLDHDFNIIFEYNGDDDLNSEIKFPWEYINIIEVSDVVIMNLPDYGYKKIIKNRFVDYDVDKYVEIKSE